MFIRFFRTNQPATLFTIPIVALLFWLPALLHPVTGVVMVQMPLYGLLINLIRPLPQWICALLGVSTISFIAIYFNNLLNNFEVLHKKSYLPSLFFVTLASCSPTVLWLHPSLPAGFILVIAMGKIFALYKNDSALPLTFDIGLLTALAVLFYFPSILFMLVFYFALIVLRPFVWREWLVSLIGFFTTFFFCWMYFYLTDNVDELMRAINDGLNTRMQLNPLEELKKYLPLASVIVIVALFAFLKLTGNFFKNVIRTRKYQQVLLSVLFFFCLPLIISPGYFKELSFILALPLAVLFAYYFTSVKKLWWLEVLFMMLLAGIVSLHLA